MRLIIKEFVRYLLYRFNRKSYIVRIKYNICLDHVRKDSASEYFFGYYDKSPEGNGKVLFHEMCEGQVKIIIKDLESDKETIIANSMAYNWQLGTRAMWITDEKVAYNDFDGERYVSRLYSLSDDKVLKTFDMPIQDYSEKGYFLGVNYQRLRSYAKEYGYYCLPELTDEEFDDYGHDGIWWIDAENGEYKLLLSIEEVINCGKIERFEKGKHFVNHIMISPSGESFIFIHRYYVGKERYDRLMYYDFKKLKCLFEDKLQSHYCWLDNTHVFGYGGYLGHNEFHTVDVNTGEVETCEELTAIHPKDGHPTKYGDWIVVDSYPYFSRMQELIAFNLKTKESRKILEVFHDMKHKGFDRCDLHPRFSKDGKRVYFDTLYTGKRELCYVDVINVIK